MTQLRGGYLRAGCAGAGLQECRSPLAAGRGLSEVPLRLAGEAVELGGALVDVEDPGEEREAVGQGQAEEGLAELLPAGPTAEGDPPTEAPGVERGELESPLPHGG